MSEGKCDECGKFGREVKCRGDIDCKARYCSEKCRDDAEFLHSICEGKCKKIIEETQRKEAVSREYGKQFQSFLLTGRSTAFIPPPPSFSTLFPAMPPDLLLNVSNSTSNASVELNQENKLFSNSTSGSSSTDAPSK